MSSDSFFLSLSWGPRKEPITALATRLHGFVADLARVDDLFAQVHKNGGRHHGQLALGKRELSVWLKEGVNRSEVDGEVIDELGFNVAMYAGDNGNVVTISLACGMYSEWVRNICTLDFPVAGSAADRLLSVGVLKKLFNAGVANWNPDRAVLTSYECCAAAHPGELPEVGWITYFRTESSESPEIQAIAEQERIKDGLLVILMEERFSSENASHIRMVKELLKKARKRPI